MTELHVPFTDEQLSLIAAAARDASLSPEAYVLAAVLCRLRDSASPQDNNPNDAPLANGNDFSRLLESVLTEDAELLRRLS